MRHCRSTIIRQPIKQNPLSTRSPDGGLLMPQTGSWGFSLGKSGFLFAQLFADITSAEAKGVAPPSTSKEHVFLEYSLNFAIRIELYQDRMRCISTRARCSGCVGRVGIFSRREFYGTFRCRCALKLHSTASCALGSGRTHRGRHRKEFGKVELWFHGKHGHQVMPFYSGECRAA